MSKLKDYLGVIITLAAVTGIVMGGISYFAKAEDLKLVEMRLDQKIVSDQVNQTQQRIWTLEDRNQGRPCTEWTRASEREEYRKLKEDLDQLKQKQHQLRK